MTPDPVPVTEEGRSWTAWVCPGCGKQAPGFRPCSNLNGHPGQDIRLRPMTAEVEVVESSRLRAVEAELGRLRERVDAAAALATVGLQLTVPGDKGRPAITAIQNALTGPFPTWGEKRPTIEFGEFCEGLSRALDAASSPGREGDKAPPVTLPPDELLRRRQADESWAVPEPSPGREGRDEQADGNEGG